MQSKDPKSSCHKNAYKNQDWLIIANGEPASAEKTQALAKNKSVIVLDGALSKALEYKITPQIVPGDFDSIDKALMDDLKKNKDIIFEHNPDRNTTDLEKALQLLVGLKAKSVSICHATGWRLDHTLYNLRLLKRFDAVFDSLILYTDIEKILFVKNKTISLAVESKQALALLAFPRATIDSQGLEYDMQSLLLEFAVQESTSNAVLPPGAQLKVEGEALLLVSHSTKLRILPQA